MTAPFAPNALVDGYLPAVATYVEDDSEAAVEYARMFHVEYEDGTTEFVEPEAVIITTTEEQ